MIPAEIISKKREGQQLDKIDIKNFIYGYLSGDVTRAQMSAFLMAVYFNGMKLEETLSLLEIMVNSGSKLNFKHSKSYVADKHSTGGIGDKISLILAPLMVASGIKIPMIAGRSLGFTGGTIDKLEAIPGINTSPSLNTFEDWITKVGAGIISQSKEICPADHKIYALRNETGTIPSLPLICSSILSKKIAEGIHGIVLDIKVGTGAFMKTKKEAYELGQLMKQVGLTYGIKVDIVYTNMNQPLGRFAGLACEVDESIECLKGNGPDDLMKITYEIGSKLLLQANLATDKNNAINKLKKLIESKIALKSFELIIKNQNGNLDDLHINLNPKYEKFLNAEKSGFFHFVDTEKLGWALVELGCGYRTPSDSIDSSSGIEFIKKTGEKVNTNEPVMRVFNSNSKRLDSAFKMLKSTFKIDKSPKKIKLFL